MYISFNYFVEDYFVSVLYTFCLLFTVLGVILHNSIRHMYVGMYVIVILSSNHYSFIAFGCFFSVHKTGTLEDLDKAMMMCCRTLNIAPFTSFSKE